MLRIAGSRSPLKDALGEVLFFENKRQAKAYRDSMSEDLEVSPGPDHRKW